MPKISVIIPTVLKDFNMLERAVNSVLFNSEIDIEVIVVNDNSSEKASLQGFIEKYSLKKVQFFHNEGQKGAGGARNFGVMQSSGDFVTFLDDDDFILPGRLKVMLDCFSANEKENLVLVSTGRIYQYNNLERFEFVRNQIFGVLSTKDIYLHNQIDIGFMVKRSFFLENNGFDIDFVNLEDWDFIIRCLEFGHAIKLKSLSYVVTNDERPNRVSNKDYLGLAKLAEKHKARFGDEWFFKVKTQEKLSNGSLSFFSSLNLSLKCKGVYPLKLYTKRKLRIFLHKGLEYFGY